MSLFPSPLDCDSFRQRIHFRDELRPGERAGFDDHAATCEPCSHPSCQGPVPEPLRSQPTPLVWFRSQCPASKPESIWPEVTTRLVPPLA